MNSKTSIYVSFHEFELTHKTKIETKINLSASFRYQNIELNSFAAWMNPRSIKDVMSLYSHDKMIKMKHKCISWAFDR